MTGSVSGHRPAQALLVLLIAAPAHAGPPQDVPLERNCFYQLQKSQSPEIDCEHPAWLTVEEKEDLRRLTRDYLQDASCRIAIRIPRRHVEEALAASDFVFESPPQPMTCDITTKAGVTRITGTFSPRVVFKGGQAVEATPGLADVEGINKYLAWPVVHYVNHADRIGSTMLLMINAYRARRGQISD